VSNRPDSGIMTVMPTPRRLLATLCAAVVASAAGCADAHAVPTPDLTVTVLGELQHDTSAYTEGLEIAPGADGSALYESTGLAGQSQLRELDPVTGAVRRAAPLPSGYFGEGITVVGDRVWQVTYRDGVAIEWDRASLTPRREVPLTGEGWGLCRDGDRLVLSDGSDRLRFIDPRDFTETGSVQITRPGGAPATGLNELECVDGQVWANVWPTDEIVRIDLASATVAASADGAVLRDGEPAVQVLNGIAHTGGGEYLLTGKNWPTSYRVRFDPVG
jgi:glutaminyl-peptide cyclotransferase